MRLFESVTCQICPNMTLNGGKARRTRHMSATQGYPPSLHVRGTSAWRLRAQNSVNWCSYHLVEKLSCESRFCVLPWSATPQPAATNRALDLVGEFRDARKVVPPVADGIFAWIEHGGSTGVVLGLSSLACVAFRNIAARHDDAPENRSCENPEGIG